MNIITCVGGLLVVQVEKIYIQGIPALHIVKGDCLNKPLPLVIFIHGFTSAKEHNLHYAYLLAEKGIRVVLPEALYHGERQQDLPMSTLPFHFWEIVINTIEEIQLVKEYYDQRGLIASQLIGVAGTSMGGIITLGALTQYHWIHSAVSLMGSPSYLSFASMQMEEMQKRGIKIPITEEEKTLLFSRLRNYDLSVHPEKMNNRPLFLWHGKLDSVVPFEYSSHFFETMKGKSNHLKLLADEKAGHQVSREGILKTIEWFEMHLKLQVVNR
jgi:uncharacterized protein